MVRDNNGAPMAKPTIKEPTSVMVNRALAGMRSFLGTTRAIADCSAGAKILVRVEMTYRNFAPVDSVLSNNLLVQVYGIGVSLTIFSAVLWRKNLGTTLIKIYTILLAVIPVTLLLRQCMVLDMMLITVLILSQK